MFGRSPKLADSVAELVGPGEPVLAAVCVSPKGSGNAMAVGGLAGAMIAGQGGKETRESSARTGVEIPRFAALAVTPQRVLVLKMNGTGSKASQIVSSIPIADVQGIEVEKSMLRKQITLSALGGTFMLECHKAAGPEVLTEALAQARS